MTPPHARFPDKEVEADGGGPARWHAAQKRQNVERAPACLQSSHISSPRPPCPARGGHLGRPLGGPRRWRNTGREAGVGLPSLLTNRGALAKFSDTPWSLHTSAPGDSKSGEALRHPGSSAGKTATID